MFSTFTEKVPAGLTRGVETFQPFHMHMCFVHMCVRKTEIDLKRCHLFIKMSGRGKSGNASHVRHIARKASPKMLTGVSTERLR